MSDDDGRPSNFVSAADLAKQKEERMQHYRAQLKEAEDEFRRKKEAAERRKQRELEVCFLRLRMCRDYLAWYRHRCCVFNIRTVLGWRQGWKAA
jgi:hypothetical protein